MDRQTRKAKQRAAGQRGPKGAPFARVGLRDKAGKGFFPAADSDIRYIERHMGALWAL
jgi:hypothetical protein